MGKSRPSLRYGVAGVFKEGFFLGVLRFGIGGRRQGLLVTRTLQNVGCGAYGGCAESAWMFEQQTRRLEPE